MPVNLQWRNGHGLLGCFPGRRNGQQDNGELDVWTVEIAPEGLGRPKVSLVFVGAWIHVDSRIYSPINRSKSGRSRYLKASSYWKRQNSRSPKKCRWYSQHFSMDILVSQHFARGYMNILVSQHFSIGYSQFSGKVIFSPKIFRPKQN